MEYINFGKVVNVSASVPVAVNDTAYHIIIDFVPNCPEIFDSFHADMGKILEWPDDYVLCNVSDIKELEDLGADLNEHIKNLERIKEFLINGNTTLIDENSKLKATNQALKERNEELEKELDMIRNLSIDSISKTLLPFGVHVGLVNPKGPGTFDLDVDIPELNEAKKKITDLEKKLEAAKSNEAYWRNRKEEEEEYHHYWLHTYNLTVAHAASKGVRIFMTGEDAENNVGVIQVKNERAEKLEKNLKAADKQLDKMDADIDELKNKNRDLEKELAESKTFAEVEYKWQSDGSFTATYTKCDGTKEVIGMDLSEAIDATYISCGTVPKCSSCAHYMHNPSRFTHDWCYMPIPKKEGGAGYIRKLNKEEAEGPACDKFEARKE